MNELLVPSINYDHAPVDGHNFYREKFSNIHDQDWREIVLRSISDPFVDGVPFPRFPDESLQQKIHGNSFQVAIGEAFDFYEFVKKHTYGSSECGRGIRLLDFGSGWGRIVRPFMRDIELKNIYGFEPNYLFCTIARVLNPYVCFLSGDFVPNNSLPEAHFNLMVGWSIFSHLSESSALLWLREAARIVTPGGACVFTTWGLRFLDRLKRESQTLLAGGQVHWYSQVCIQAAGSVDAQIENYKSGEFVWFTNGQSKLYGEAFVSREALEKLIRQFSLPFCVETFDTSSLSQDVFVLRRQ